MERLGISKTSDFTLHIGIFWNKKAYILYKIEGGN